MSLVRDPDNIRLAMLGMVDGNGHPYSWSAIVNGAFDADAMSRCPYPVIPQYLAAAQPTGALGIAGARVTHIWCDDPADAQRVAQASLIAEIVRDPTDVIGRVDAVIIPTDRGEEHLDRARPFVEAGLPVFIDKPLTDRADHLRQVATWERQGRAIMSRSCMRYAAEFAAVRERLGEVGELRVLTMSMCKSWERYGIHALEGFYPLLAPGGWETATWTGDDSNAIVHFRHRSGVTAAVLQAADLYGAFGCLSVYGTQGALAARFADTVFAFKAQLEDFIRYLRTGRRPFDFAQTIELMKMLIAATRSRDSAGRSVRLDDVAA